ncbi:hypothetical protein LTR17_000109 [Elasticomyces elasticus]|nr:hypothetical protein LTR17_000109 [Elasticomyces elasticus]
MNLDFTGGYYRKGWYAEDTEPSSVGNAIASQMSICIEVKPDDKSLLKQHGEIGMMCRASHTACGDARAESWQPARLLHWTCMDPTWATLVLCEAKFGHYGPDVLYMTLSHRWVPGEEALLQKDNMGRLRQGLNYDELKASIQDGLTLSKHLGYEYLWIDCLCIMQDDAEDVARQISQMDKVYSNSVCNIAASDATNTSEGCFYEHDIPSVQTYNFRLDGDTSKEARHHVRPTYMDIRGTLVHTALDKRAWVFQERVLAPRTVHCGRTQLYWECREMTASETWPQMTPPRNVRVQLFHRNGIFARSPPSNVWGGIVSNYFNRSLTCSGDSCAH